MDDMQWSPLLHAAFGGFMLNMMTLYEVSKKPKNRRANKDALYWVFFFFWPMAGAGLAYIYMESGYNIKGLLAFTTGLTAPMLIQTMMEKVVSPTIEPMTDNVEEAAD